MIRSTIVLAALGFVGVVLATRLDVGRIAFDNIEDRPYPTEFALPVSLSGYVYGYGGAPVSQATATIVDGGQVLQRAFTDADGRFRLSVDSIGAYYLWVTGVHHRNVLIPIYMDKLEPTNLRVSLEPVGYSEPTTEVVLTGSFNGFSYSRGLIPMEINGDGTYTGTFPAPADTFAYQIIARDYSELAVAGTMADRYVYPERFSTFAGRAGRWVSVVSSPNDSVTISFDPSELPFPEGRKASVAFSDSLGRMAKIARYSWLIEEVANPWIDSLRSYNEANPGGRGFTYDDSRERRTIREWAEAEEDEVVRHFVLLRYLRDLKPTRSDSVLARSLLSELEPTSLLWSELWADPTYAFLRIEIVANDEDATARYATRLIETHRDRDVVASFLYYRVAVLFQHMQKAKMLDPQLREVEVDTALSATELFSVYYDKLITDFGESYQAENAIKSFAPERRVRVGESVPDFALPSIDDSSRVLSPDAFAGRFFLIDFWAVWCGPCIGEMEYLHEAQEEFGKKGLEIVSISFDRSPETVHEFRAGRWAMPWHHAFVEDGFFSNLADDFEVVGIPKVILVAPDGRIAATGQDLRGEALIETLRKAF